MFGVKITNDDHEDTEPTMKRIILFFHYIVPLCENECGIIKADILLSCNGK